MQLFRFLKSPKFFIHLTLAIILVTGIIWSVLRLLEIYTLHGQTITVPDLSGLKAGELDKVVLEKELKYEIVDSIYDSQRPKGVVVDQDPEPESQVKANRTIYLTMNSQLPPRIPMPNLVDKSLRSALIVLENLGLKTGDHKFIPDICKNCVLKQQINGNDIPEGELIPKGSKVELILGMGISNKLIRVPLLIGLQKDSAISELQRHYLNLGAETYDETVLTAEDTLESTVYEQDPFYSENSFLPLGSSVNLRFTINASKIDTNLRNGYVSDQPIIISTDDDTTAVPD